MATDTFELEAPSGLTLTADVYPEGSDTASFSGVSLTERTSGKGTYRGTVSAPTAGAYKVHAKVGTDVIGVYWVRLANDGADHYCGDRDSWGALPKAAPDAAGGLPISDAGGLDLDARLDVAVGSRSSHSAADVWSVGTRTLTSFGSLVSDIASAVWGAASRLLTGIGSSGIASETTAAAAKTAAEAARDDLANGTDGLGAILARLGSPANADLAADIAAVLASIALRATPAQVATEIADALRADSGTELSSPPAKDAPVAAQVQWLFQALRNGGTQTATARTTRNDAGSTTGTQAVSDDGTTLTVGKAS